MISTRAQSKKPKKPKQLYGIAEWYGRLYRSLTDAERRQFANTKNTSVPCPFLNQVPALGPKSGKLNCNKAGGVCSLRNFHELSADSDLTFGPITATCPNRFLEGGTVIKQIAQLVLNTDSPLYAKELPFLRRPRSPVAQTSIDETAEDSAVEDVGVADAGNEDVGRIDLVLVNPDDPEKWCAVEVQAVYFSGASMASDLKAIQAYSGNGVPMPALARRPDFRSSGPKRLMPQLMIKVPALRRWGHKMVVVVDEPFFDAMDEMEESDHISNSDIIWVVAKFDDSLGVPTAPLVIAKTVFTTLESAVKGLTAGQPTTLPEFQAKLGSKTAPTF